MDKTIKIMNFYPSRHQLKTIPEDEKKIFVNQISDKGFLFWIQKSLTMRW